MNYDAATLKEIAPYLDRAIETATTPAMKQRGRQLKEAAIKLTQWGDLAVPVLGANAVEQIVCSFLIPPIKSFIQQVGGQPAASDAMNLFPSLVFTGIHISKAIGH